VETQPFPIEVNHNPNANVANLYPGRPSQTRAQKICGRLVHHIDHKIPVPILSSDPCLQALFDQILA
jgi:hypothetical protein